MPALTVRIARAPTAAQAWREVEAHAAVVDAVHVAAALHRLVPGRAFADRVRAETSRRKLYAESCWNGRRSSIIVGGQCIEFVGGKQRGQKLIGAREP